MYRSNFQSRLIEEYLREAGIAYTVVGSTSFYERKEIKDVLAYLRLIGQPLDEVSLHRVMNYPKRGIGKLLFSKLTKSVVENTPPYSRFLHKLLAIQVFPKMRQKRWNTLSI